MQDATEDERWQFLTSHDLRRPWATRTYYSLYHSSVVEELVMRWGGWDDRATFRTNYLGRAPDPLVVETMEEARLV